jgi:L-iditol 2-dehydrogenase
MQALILDAPRKLRFGEFPEPSVGPDGVLINIRACGICGSDVHGYDGSGGRRIPPLVMGREAAVRWRISRVHRAHGHWSD